MSDVLSGDIVRIPVIRNPITREKLVKEMKKDNCDEVYQKLFIRSLMPIICKNLNKTYLDYDWKTELVHDSIVHLVKVIDKYDESKGTKFITWAWSVIRNHIIFKSNKIIRTNKIQINNSQSPNEKIREIDFDEINEDKKHENKTLDMKSDLYSCVRKLIEIYPDKRNIIIGLLGNPETMLNDSINFSIAAKKSGCSVCAIKRFHKEIILPFLSKKLSVYGYGEKL